MHKYLTYGQKSFNFLVTPKELENILSEYHLVIHDTRVTKDYLETEHSYYLESYTVLFNMLSSGARISWKRDYNHFKSIGVTSELAKCKYEKYVGEDKIEYIKPVRDPSNPNIISYEKGCMKIPKSNKYVIPDFDEPVPTISPMVFTVDYDSFGKIHCSTSYGVSQFAECFFGLKLTYPTKIQFSAGDDYEDIHTTVGLSGHNDYSDIVSKIKNITSTIKIKYKLGTISPNIRISNKAKEQIANCFLLEKYNLLL